MNQTTTKSYPNIGQSFGMVGIMILAQLVFAPIIIFMPKMLTQEFAMLIYYLCSVGGSLLIFFFIRRSNGNASPFIFSMGQLKILPYLIVVPIALAAGVITPISSLIPMPEFIEKAILEMSTQTSIYSFLMMVIAAPVFEEFIFRGIMLDGLLKKYKPVIAILISSFLFGLVHLNPWQFITGMIIGLFSGWVYYRSKSLSYSILVHVVVNLSGFILRLLGTEQDINATSLPELYGGKMNALLFTSGFVLLAVLGCIMLNNKLKSEQPDLIESFEEASSSIENTKL